MLAAPDLRTESATAAARVADHGLAQLAANLPQCRLHGGDLRISAVVSHTDQVRPGALFACLPGVNRDGHRFAAAAVERGAAALLVEHWLPNLGGVPQLEVPDARIALAHLARALHGHPDRRLLVLAVTGTNGKTTTAHMLHTAFGAARRPLGLLGTVGYRLGRRELEAPLTTPDPLALHAMLAEMVAAGLHGVSMEASSHALAQHRLEGLEVDTAVFTNLTRDHLDYHGTPMAYLAAKRRLFEPRAGHKSFPALAVICTDGAAGRLLAREARAQRQVVTCALSGVWTAGRPGAPDVSGRYRQDGARGILSVRGAWGRGEVVLPLPGRHNAQNALAALTAALANGVPFDTAAQAIRTMDPVPGRFETVDGGQGFLVVVDFAHNPDGLRWSLLAARRRCAGTLRLVFGCKGGDGDDVKRRRMGTIAGRLADVVYLTTDDPYGEDPAAIASRVQRGLAGARAVTWPILDRAEAIRRAIADASPGDLVLVAGRGHERRQPAAGRLLPLDDRQICRTALAERGGNSRGAVPSVASPGGAG